jgi:hypothetical protein
LLPLFLASRDAACPACGYNLRGLREARCPECGEAIALRVGLVEPLDDGTHMMIADRGGAANRGIADRLDVARRFCGVTRMPNLKVTHSSN